MPSTQIHNSKKSKLAFWHFRSEVLALLIGALCPFLLRSASCTVLANFQQNKGRSEQTKYTTFLNSSWGVFKRNMRVVIFWTMCHLSLGHEKKASLNKLQIAMGADWILGEGCYGCSIFKKVCDNHLKNCFKKIIKEQYKIYGRFRGDVKLTGWQEAVNSGGLKIGWSPQIKCMTEYP